MREEVSVQRWIEVIEELRYWLGPFWLSLSGGEVFVKKGIFDLIARAVELDVSLSVLTNGLSFRSKECLEKLLATGIRAINISVDSADPEIHDKYRGVPGLHATIVSAVRTLKEHDESMFITFVCIVMRETLPGLVRYVQWATDLGVDRVIFQPVEMNFGAPGPASQWQKDSDFFIRDLALLDITIDRLIGMKQETGLIANDIDNLEKMKLYFRDPSFVQIKRNRCMLGQANLLINEFGDMSFCYRFNNIFGNIDNGCIRDTWRAATANGYRAEIKRCRRPCMSVCYRSYTLVQKISMFYKYTRIGRL